MSRQRFLNRHLALLCMLSALGAVSCIKRYFNSESNPETIFQVSQPRIAIDYLGLGWCYYLEDKTQPVMTFKTDEIDEDVDVDLSTGIETRTTFQLKYSIRHFKRAHTASIEYGALDEWRKKNEVFSDEFKDQWDTLQILDGELSRAAGTLSVRKVEENICKKIYKDRDQPDFDLLKTEYIKKNKLSQYVLRCYGDSGQLMSLSKLETATPSGYNLIRKILSEISSSPEYTHLTRRGATCRETLKHLELSRGQFLRSTKTKVF